MRRFQSGMSSARLAALASTTLVAAHAPHANAQTTWTGGAGDGNWYTAANWNTGVVPTPADAVVIPAGFPTVSASGAFASQLAALSPLSVGTGGTGVAGTASLKDFSTTGGFLSGGSASFAGTVSVNTSFPWQAANGFSSTGLFNVTNMPLSLSTFSNDGTLTVQDGTLTLGGSGVNLFNHGTLELRSNGNLFSNGALFNDGTFRKVGAFPSLVQCRIVNTSATPITVNDGLLRLTGGGGYGEATFDVDLGATLRVEGPFVAPLHYFSDRAEFKGDGELEIQGASNESIEFADFAIMNMKGPDGLHMQSGGVKLVLTLFNDGIIRWDGGTFNGPGNIQNEGTAGTLGTITIPAGKSVALKSDCDLKNYGTLAIAGILTIDPDVEVVNSGKLTLSGEIRAPIPGQGLVTNEFATALEVDAGGGVAKIQARFVNAAADTVVKSGTLSLLGGGELFSASLVTQQPATLLAFDAGTFDVTGNSAFIQTNGETRIRGAGTKIKSNANGQLTFTGSGIAYLQLGAQLGGPGLAVNNGTFVWNSQVGIDGQANFRNESPGVVLLQGGSLRGSFTNDLGALVTQIGGLDMANSTASNDADWFIEPPTASTIGVTGVNGLLVNGPFALLQAKAPLLAGRSVNITITLDNQGTVRATGGIVLTIGGQIVQLQNGVLEGGTWEAVNSGKLVLPGVPAITKIKNATVRGSKAGMPWLAGVKTIENANVTIDDDTAFTGPLQVGGNGQPGSTLTIEPGVDVTVPGGTTVGEPAPSTNSFLDPEGTFSFAGPSGLTTPVLVMHGTTRPGGPSSAGLFNLVGDLSMQSSGVMEFELGGLLPLTEHDQTSIVGGASLTGTLAVKLLSGFVPELGQNFEILTATGAITGTFANLTSPPGLPANLKLEPVYTPGKVTLSVVATCYPDCDASGDLNIDDFICFQTLYALGDPKADCDLSGGLDIDDFICFQTFFAIGC